MQRYCCLLQVLAAPMSCARWIWPCTARFQACIYIYWAAHYVKTLKSLYICIYGLYMPNPSLAPVYMGYTYMFAAFFFAVFMHYSSYIYHFSMF